MMSSMMGAATSHAHAAAQNENEAERIYSPNNRDSSASFRFSLAESSATRVSNTTPAAGGAPGTSTSPAPPRSGSPNSLKAGSLVKRDANETPRCLIDPRKSGFMGYWDIAGLLALVFTALVTPFEIAHLSSELNALFFTNRVVDLIFITDLILQFFLVYEDMSVADASERWVLDHRQIANNYLKSWFLIDLVSCLVSGFDFVGLTPGVDRSLLAVLRALRLIKLLRLVKLKRLFRRWEKRLTFNYGTMALCKCVIYVLLTCHWCACAWTLQTLFVSDLMATWRGQRGYCWYEDSAPSTWQVEQTGPNAIADEDGIICTAPGATWVAGFYLMMMTITSVGYGDISAENTYEQVVLSILILTSALMWSQVISTFCLVLANSNPADQAFYNGMDSLNAFLSSNAVPKKLRADLRTYFHETRSLRLHRLQRQLYQDMSPTLAATTFMEIHGSALSHLWILRECSKETRFRVMDRMRTRIYAPGERTEALGLYLIERGRAIYRGALMKRHDVWGEDSVVQDVTLVRSAEAKALEYLEVSVLSREDMLKMLHDMPPRDAKWVRSCAIKIAFCRYVVQQNHLMKEGGLRALVSTQKRTNREAELQILTPAMAPPAVPKMMMSASASFDAVRAAGRSASPPPGAAHGDLVARVASLEVKMEAQLGGLARAVQALHAKLDEPAGGADLRVARRLDAALHSA